MKKNIFVIICLLIGVYNEISAGDDVYGKLFAELKKYAIVREKYSNADLPVLTGNAVMGGLTDPLGRGVCNIEMNDLYLNEEARVVGPGMMLKMSRFVGEQPSDYFQKYDLETGILSTNVTYPDGAYDSELFFSHDDRELLVYSLTNRSDRDLLCNIDLGQFNFRVVNYSDSTVYCASEDGGFTSLHYYLQTNIPFGKTNFPNRAFLPWSRDIFLTVPANKTLEIKVRLKVKKDNAPQQFVPTANVGELRAKHVDAWRKNWRSMGFVVLPESDYARTFYRSLHWLQCVAGVEKNLPGECQFATFTSRIANEYNLRAKINISNGTAWNQLPFTYGGTGWSILAYTWLGDDRRAGAMLAGLYRPDALKRNVTGMFPVGEFEFVYGGKHKGRYKYLADSCSDAFCFAHENLFDGVEKPYPPSSPWDRQIHIQGFAPAMYYHYNRMFAQKEDTVYAVMRGSAEFWRNILHRDAKSKTYTLPPLLSVTEDLFEADILDGLLAAKWTLTQAAALAQKRNADENLRKQWLHIASNIRIKDINGVYSEFADDDGSRAGAGYQGIRGYFYLGFPTLELMKNFSSDKVNKSLDQCWLRNKKGEGMITFIANWFALTDAYWGRAEAAMEKSAGCLVNTEPTATAMCEQNGSLYYFLTGYASFAMVPVAMSLQSAGDEIRVFPAVPEQFGDIEFYNLPATGGVRVSGAMKGGKTQFVRFEQNGKTLLEVTGKDRVKARWTKGKLTQF
jgi:hypothetical protein